MNIAYFVPGPISRGPLGKAEIRRREAYLGQHAFEGTRVLVREASDGPASVESTVEEQLAVPAMLEAVPELQREFDAIIIGCFDDPGLAAARELADIPIIGPAQASSHLAAQLGDRFAVLTVLDDVIPMLHRLFRTYALDRLVTEIRAVDVPVLELRSHSERVLENLVREGRAALAAGADTLILGCMTMGFLEVARELQEELGAPVVNPVLASLKAAESAVALRAVHSRKAYPSPRKAALAAL